MYFSSGLGNDDAMSAVNTLGNVASNLGVSMDINNGDGPIDPQQTELPKKKKKHSLSKGQRKQRKLAKLRELDAQLEGYHQHATCSIDGMEGNNRKRTNSQRGNAEEEAWDASEAPQLNTSEVNKRQKLSSGNASSDASHNVASSGGEANVYVDEDGVPRGKHYRKNKQRQQRLKIAKKAAREAEASAEGGGSSAAGERGLGGGSGAGGGVKGGRGKQRGEGQRGGRGNGKGQGNSSNYKPHSKNSQNQFNTRQSSRFEYAQNFHKKQWTSSPDIKPRVSGGFVGGTSQMFSSQGNNYATPTYSPTTYSQSTFGQATYGQSSPGIVDSYGYPQMDDQEIGMEYQGEQYCSIDRYPMVGYAAGNINNR